MLLHRLLLLIMLAGGIIVALPDKGARLFSFSSDHGPSVQDAAGLALVLLPYFYFVVAAWKKRSRLLAAANTRFFLPAIFLAGLGAGLIIASVAGDYKYWWICGAIVLAMVQAVALYIVFLKKTGNQR